MFIKGVILCLMLMASNELFAELSSSVIAPVTTKAGRVLSLNFQDISIRSALQLLAEFSGLNIITSDSITGHVTIHVENIPWDQALDLILQSQGLGKRKFANVLFIAPLSEIASREKQALEARQQMEDLAPLESTLLTINYGKAEDIANLLQGLESNLLSTRGSVSVDARTNTIWIEDTAKKLAEIRNLVHKLDMPVKQVLIEARIVNVDCNYEQELGINFKASKTEQAANSTNVQFNMDLAANMIGGINPATLALALARLGKGTLLDLELSALESEGAGQIISSPRIITADQQLAKIQSGEEIPYQESTSSGATNITFKEAVLSLNVTPQITPGNQIILNLKLNQDKVGARLVQGVPSIDTREIETQILVENGETIVLGGIYETDHNKQIKRLSFFGSLPLVGSLFRHKSLNNVRKELLIFVTPHILR